MKILISFVLLFQFESSQASLIGIMDSGTDISHKDLVAKTWFNPNEKEGSADLDLDGLPGDVNGWDFITNTASPFDPQYNYLIDNEVKTFFLLYSKYETRTINSNEINWLKARMDDKVLMNKVNFVGGYIHGTHVAGISTVNVPNAKILSLKLIPTSYEEVSAAASNPQASPNARLTTTTTIEDFKKDLVTSAVAQVSDMITIHSLLQFHKVDVVNQSFGIGFNDAKGFIKSGFIDAIKREPTEAELNNLVRFYMAQLMLNGPKMFLAAPNTIFVIAAGNDTSDNDVFPDYPAGIQADNKIVVAATVGYRSLADFSNFGATKVDVAAPGVAITSTAPTNAYIALSGTSQAAPFVTNVVAQIKDINPSLSLQDAKAIIFGTVDVKPWLAKKVKTSGIVNKARATKAALYSKTMNVALAISKARAEIADVPVSNVVNKSLIEKLDFDYKPLRPSLLIKKLK